jgi:hypothetical protein
VPQKLHDDAGEPLTEQNGSLQSIKEDTKKHATLEIVKSTIFGLLAPLAKLLSVDITRNESGNFIIENSVLLELSMLVQLFVKHLGVPVIRHRSVPIRQQVRQV